MARRDPADLQQLSLPVSGPEDREAERVRLIAESVDTDAVVDLARTRPATARRSAAHRLHVDVAEDLFIRFEEALDGRDALTKRAVIEQLIEGWVSGR